MTTTTHTDPIDELKILIREAIQETRNNPDTHIDKIFEWQQHKFGEFEESVAALIRQAEERGRLQLVQQMLGNEEYIPFEKHVDAGWLKDGALDALEEERDRLATHKPTEEKSND